ncbi:hypothetical protein NKH77_54505 [Streptomyces sp. M19]
MEVHAHFAAGRDSTALALIRREWGYMLQAPHGTASTFWEGYRTDGTSDYDGSYMSAAHGWSTGPTSALTFHLLGCGPPGGRWRLPDHAATGRTPARAGQLTTPLGVIGASWRRRPNGWFDLRFKAPEGAVETVAVPVAARECVVRVGRRRSWDGRARAHDARFEDGYVHLTGIRAGPGR